MMPVGRVVAVAAGSQNKDAAYWVAKHISYDRSLDDVSTMLTGLDPYRTTHFEHPEAFTMFGDKAEAQAYLKGVEAALADGFPEIFIPGAAAYTTALDLHVHKALAGEETPQQRWTPRPRNGTRSPTSSAATSRSSCGSRPWKATRPWGWSSKRPRDREEGAGTSLLLPPSTTAESSDYGASYGGPS